MLFSFLSFVLQESNKIITSIKSRFISFFVLLHVTTKERKNAEPFDRRQARQYPLLSASAVDTGATDNDDGSSAQLTNVNKKKPLLAWGGSILSVGVLAQVYDQYTRFTFPGRSFSSSQYRSSSEMSAAAAKLRRSSAQTPNEGMGSSRLEQ